MTLTAPPIRIDPPLRTPGATTLRTWRHCDDATLKLPDLDGAPAEILTLGPETTEDRLVERLFADGVRRVEIEDVVDLSGEMEPGELIPIMLRLGELTSLGVQVDWRVRLGANPAIWQSLSHLMPPREVVDADASIVADWRAVFYVGKCLYRFGPGFVQVRDRRDGSLHRLTIDDPRYLAGFEALRRGCPTSVVAPEVMADFLAEGLAAVIGDWAWWLPYQVRRWPWPAFVI